MARPRERPPETESGLPSLPVLGSGGGVSRHCSLRTTPFSASTPGLHRVAETLPDRRAVFKRGSSVGGADYLWFRPMAVVTATSSGSISGRSALLRGLFKLMRGDRMTLSGRNGARSRPCCGFWLAKPKRLGIPVSEGRPIAPRPASTARPGAFPLRNTFTRGRSDVIATERELGTP